MWKKMVVAICIIVVITGIVIGCFYFINKDNDTGDLNVTVGQRYYIKTLYNGMYYYPDPATGIETNALIKFKSQDHSYCVFEDDFKTLKIKFCKSPDTTGDQSTTTFDFVVTKIKNKSGKLSATVRHIYNGKIITYSVTSNKTQITMKTTVTYEVQVSDNEYEPIKPKKISRTDTITMTFLLAQPSYVGGTCTCDECTQTEAGG